MGEGRVMEIEKNLQGTILQEATHVCEEKENKDVSAEETVKKEVAKKCQNRK